MTHHPNCYGLNSIRRHGRGRLNERIQIIQHHEEEEVVVVAVRALSSGQRVGEKLNRKRVQILQRAPNGKRSGGVIVVTMNLDFPNLHRLRHRGVRLIP